MVENEKKMPFFQKKVGQLQVAVWENTNAKGGKWFSTNLVRNYFDEASKSWKKTTSLRTSDLDSAVVLLKEAHNKIKEVEKSASSPSSTLEIKFRTSVVDLTEKIRETIEDTLGVEILEINEISSPSS